MINATNMKFGRLTAIKVIGKNKNRNCIWECICDCGNIVNVNISDLKRGKTKSCGCLSKETNTLLFKKYNTYDLTGDYGIGYDHKGEEFYFDLEDYDKIKDYLWKITKNKYIRNTNDIFLHKLITDTNKSILIDHKNNNPKDNRKNNLRIATYSQNSMNKKSVSKFGTKGISWNKQRNLWEVYFSNKDIKLREYFKDIFLAINKRIEWENKYCGEFRYAWENNINWKNISFHQELNETEWDDMPKFQVKGDKV